MYPYSIPFEMVLISPTGDGEVAEDAQLQIHPVSADIHHEVNAKRSKFELMPST